MMQREIKMQRQPDGKYIVTVDGGSIECGTTAEVMSRVGHEMGMPFNRAQRQLFERMEAAEKVTRDLEAENAQLKTQIPQWVSVDERLPEDKEIVLVYWSNAHCCERDNYSVMRFHKGRTAEELKAASSVRPCDQWGNNKKPYCWNDPHGPLSLFGQDVTYWMPLPEPPLEEYELEGGIFDPYFVEGFE